MLYTLGEEREGGRDLENGTQHPYIHTYIRPIFKNHSVRLESSKMYMHADSGHTHGERDHTYSDV